jgi:predicted Zn-dependent protease
VYLTSGDEKKLAASLEQLAERDADEFTFRKKLAQMALEAENYATAARWAKEATQVDVMDVDVHEMHARALLGDNKPERAIEAYQTALLIDPKDNDLRLGLAKAQIAAKQPDKARATLEELLKLDSKYAEAKELLEALDQ